ncbi:hypothetical protein Clacol_008541 [Clathrus columnatus]|uniref:N-acetyltransferase domain-containing protein n=1 Tax=Clathrus columnatus TaxID=1419009 RepID=A0AAV5AKT1_9AGAM|nr:hypothetical protein Clacol_008541 [Clathrus columnatus]
MLVNSKTAIIGARIVLVPYRPEHKYHQWMLSSELRELTASEPLNLEEEYTMQKSWQLDNDKLTFILLARPDRYSGTIPTNDDIKTYPMIGDVNLFFKGTRNHNNNNGDDEDDDADSFQVETEIMIAEPSYRRKGLASEALSLLFAYATSPSGPKELCLLPQDFIVRIGESNTASLNLFEKLGFVINKRVKVFKEVEMRFRPGHVFKWTEGETVEFD